MYATTKTRAVGDGACVPTDVRPVHAACTRTFKRANSTREAAPLCGPRRGGGRRRSMREGVSRVWRHVVIIFLCGRWPRGSCWRRLRTAGQIMVRRPVARASHVRSTSAIRRHVSTRSALQPLSSLRQVMTWRRGRHGHAAGVAGDEARIERRQRFPPLLAQVLRHGPRTGRWRGNVRPVAYACCELAAVRVVHHHLHHHLHLGRVTARLCCGIIRCRVRMSAGIVRCRVTETACFRERKHDNYRGGSRRIM